MKICHLSLRIFYICHHRYHTFYYIKKVRHLFACHVLWLEITVHMLLLQRRLCWRSTVSQWDTLWFHQQPRCQVSFYLNVFLLLHMNHAVNLQSLFLFLNILLAFVLVLMICFVIYLSMKQLDLFYTLILFMMIIYKDTIKLYRLRLNNNDTVHQHKTLCEEGCNKWT